MEIEALKKTIIEGQSYKGTTYQPMGFSQSSNQRKIHNRK